MSFDTLPSIIESHRANTLISSRPVLTPDTPDKVVAFFFCVIGEFQAGGGETEVYVDSALVLEGSDARTVPLGLQARLSFEADEDAPDPMDPYAYCELLEKVAARHDGAAMRSLLVSSGDAILLPLYDMVLEELASIGAITSFHRFAAND